jgi:hypothetical protein
MEANLLHDVEKEVGTLLRGQATDRHDDGPSTTRHALFVGTVQPCDVRYQHSVQPKLFCELSLVRREHCSSIRSLRQESFQEPRRAAHQRMQVLALEEERVGAVYDEVVLTRNEDPSQETRPRRVEMHHLGT